MKVKFCLDNGKCHNSTHETEWLDTVEDLDLQEGQWEEMDDDERLEMVDHYWLEKGFPASSYEEKDD